jgi:hypothetical protein
MILLELNEINFEHLAIYGKDELPVLTQLIEKHGVAQTTSEVRYEELEPWIQWVTAHTGLTLAEHGVFRLGDIVRRELKQIWEALEDLGLKVGAVSPMNASNRCQEAAFFVPDPWTSTRLTASPLLHRLYDAIAQAVGDNAQSRLTARSVAWLLAGLIRYARFANYGRYSYLATAASRKPWSKAILLDVLLADVFIKETRRAKPDFGSLFLNAGAHIQHHYMFNSAAYDGPLRNPEWYVAKRVDPVLEVYRVYDDIVGQIMRRFPDARLMIATGLHQDPHTDVTYYWRLRDHGAFLKKIGANFENVEPRMSRDFLVTCDTAEKARIAEGVIESARGQDGLPLFEVDNRGRDLFVMLTYPNDVADDFSFAVSGHRYDDLRSDITFVAIKNGRHNGTGYFIDSGAHPGEVPSEFPLKLLPRKICNALGVEWSGHRQEPSRAKHWP